MIRVYAAILLYLLLYCLSTLVLVWLIQQALPPLNTLPEIERKTPTIANAKADVARADVKMALSAKAAAGIAPRSTVHLLPRGTP